MRLLLAIALLGFTQTACAQSDDVVEFDYRVVNVFPHDRHAYTQGLFFRDGVLYESTGLRGFSSIRRVTLQTGDVQQRHDLAPQYFGEGIVDWGDKLIGVTWQSQKGFIFDLDSFEESGTFSYSGEAWGLARNNSHIIMSDGTDRLRFFDPDTFAETDELAVTLRGSPLRNLNELEWINGEIWSNVWQTNWIVRIDPGSGAVTGAIDLSGLLPDADRTPRYTDVLNGIAFDEKNERLFVTGKRWPKLFEIELVKRPE